MSFYEDSSIIITPNAYKAGELYAVIPVPTYGAELVTNGDFATDTDWTINTGWTISGGSANCDGNNQKKIYQNIGLAASKSYEYIIDVKTLTSGTITLFYYNGSYQTIAQNLGLGTHNLRFSTSGTPNGFIYINSNSFVGSVDNVSVKEWTGADMDVTRATAATRVDENGLVNYAEILGSEEVTNGDFTSGTTGWSASYSGTLNNTGNALNVVAVGANDTRVSTSAITVIGRSYKFVSDINQIQSSSTQLSVSNNSNLDGAFENGSNITTPTNGVTIYFTATATTTYVGFKRAGGAADGVTNIYDNVSVKEADLDNVPRIDYTGGGCPHILAEPQSTNLITYSEDFSQWGVGQSVVVPNQLTSPSGEITADKLNALNSTNQQYINVVPTVSSGSVYTLSCFAKKGEVDYISLVGLNPFTTSFFDLNNGTVLGNTATSSSIEDFGNGWYRCTSTFDADTTSKFSGIYLSYNGTSLSNGTNISNGEGVYVYGAQLEEGSYATSYIPTSGATVTRNQDVFTRDGISSLINSEEGVLFVEMAAFDNGTYNVWSLSNLSNKEIFIGARNGLLASSLYDGTTFVINSSTALLDGNNKAALKWVSGVSAEVWLNGFKVYTYTGTIPTYTANDLTTFSQGDRQGSFPFYGKVKQLQVYKTALSDSELTILTTP